VPARPPSIAAQVFVSFRRADASEVAAALARDLRAVFGAPRVFIDDSGARDGRAWAEQIARCVDERPVLLLLMSSELFYTQDGRLRVADEGDRVHREVSVALAAGAHLIPVLCNGAEPALNASLLPAPFNRIGGLGWRRLHADAWAADMQRLVAELQAFGVDAAPPNPNLHALRTLLSGRLWLALVLLALALGVGYIVAA
jgi:hypothetical protein